jgi:hypothetical protein
MVVFVAMALMVMVMAVFMFMPVGVRMGMGMLMNMAMPRSLMIMGMGMRMGVGMFVFMPFMASVFVVVHIYTPLLNYIEGYNSSIVTNLLKKNPKVKQAFSPAPLVNILHIHAKYPDYRVAPGGCKV